MVEARKKGGCCGSSKPKPVPRPPPVGPGGEPIQAGFGIDNYEPEVKTAKVIFMGDRSVGKTSIIKTFMEGHLQ